MTEDEREFMEAYERLSGQGRCDSPGGMEYKRVLQEWREAGQTANIDDFITRQANVRSDGTYPGDIPQERTTR